MVRNMTIAVALAAGFFGIQSPASAGLKFANTTSETIWLAVASATNDGWRTDGWYEIKPGRTLEVISGNLKYQYYYVHAYTASRRDYWKGNHDFWVHPTEIFTIMHVDGQRPSVPNGGKRVGFQQIDTGPKARDYKVNLRIAGAGTIID
jgi:uncharacterized membrane protein